MYVQIVQQQIRDYVLYVVGVTVKPIISRGSNMKEMRITWEEHKLTVHPFATRHFAWNDGDELLGKLERIRVGKFMQWVWVQEEDIYMTAGCMDEVRNKQRELNARRAR